MKKKRYEEGGEIKFETKRGSVSGIDDVRARAMAAMASQLRDETGEVSSIRRNQETGELYDTAMPKPRAAAKKAAKKLPMPDYSNEDLDRMGLNESMNEMPKSLRAPGYMPPSVVKTINKKNVTKPTPRSPGRMVREESDLAMTSPMEDKGRRLMKGAGMDFKAGGKVSSASKRADGCAIRGKTRA
jgi:hypothetical protein